MQLRNPKELIKWKLNPKTQTKEQHERMVERYKQFGQLTNFKVMPDSTILGGNHGLDVLLELDLQAKCDPVDFLQEGDEWFFINDGEIIRHVSYKTKEEGMFKVSAAHNERFSQYDAGELANLIGNYQIEMPDYSFDFYEQPILGKLGLTDPTNDKEEEEIKEKKLRNVVCPHCKESFTM